MVIADGRRRADNARSHENSTAKIKANHWPTRTSSLTFTGCSRILEQHSEPALGSHASDNSRTEKASDTI
jgi:predicted amidohydrolase